MAMKYHPDKVHHPVLKVPERRPEKFKKINEAYEEVKRAGEEWFRFPGFEFRFVEG